MIKKIKMLALSFVAAGALTFAVAAPASAQLLNPGGGVDEGLSAGICATDPDSCASDPDAESRVMEIIRLIINIFSVVVGVVSVIMIIIGGLKYITSAGESSNVTSAKNTIMYAIIGLVIVALAQFIVRFVFERVTGA